MSTMTKENAREFKQAKIDLFYFIDKSNLRNEASTLIKLALKNSTRKSKKSKGSVNCDQKELLLKLKEYKFTQSKIVSFLKEKGFKVSQGAISQMKSGKMVMPKDMKDALQTIIKE